MTNKYRVEIGYRKFTFDDRSEAIDFAETAFNSSDDREGVSIDLIRVEEKQEDEDDDE